MGDYRWIPEAVMDHSCSMCSKAIRRGEGLYFELERRDIFCRGCGREIRRVGEDEARRSRADWASVFQSLFGRTL